MAPAPQFHQRLAERLQQQTDRIKSGQVIARALIEGEQAKKALASMSGKIEIKGLAQAFAAAKASIATARNAPAELASAVSEMVATCADLTTQVKAMHDDIKFEATQLGNGGETDTKL